MIVVALGIGTSFPALMTLAMSGATPEDAGLASGVVNTSAQVGGAIGLAVLATLATERTHSLEASGTAFNEALNSGFHLAYLVGAALVGAAFLVAVFAMKEAPAHGHEMAPEGEGEPAYADAG